MIRHGATAVAAVVLTAMAFPGAACAAFGFAPGGLVIHTFDTAEEPYSLAGGHPARMVLAFGFNTDESNEGALEGNPKDIYLDFPPGFSGDPSAVPACPRAVLEESVFEGSGCDPASQVGVLKLTLNGFFTTERAIYNVEPAPGQLAVQSAVLFGKLSLLMRQRADDFGLTIELTQLVQTVAVSAGEIELWGVPADHQSVTGAPRRPFVTLPTRCDQGPLTVTARADSWQEPGHWVTASGGTGEPITGCDALPFDPAITFELTSQAVDSPSGANVEVTMPQEDEPDGRASAAMRNVDVALPENVSISPGAVAGLAVCSDDELGFGKGLAAACPAAAKVGSMELDAPQLASPLGGSIYLGEERPGQRFRLFLVAEGEGVIAKLIGTLRSDPVTGRITVALEDLPALSFRRIGLDFQGGPGALLATPVACGGVTATATFARFGGFPAVGASAASEITEGADGLPCPAAMPFSPSFSGGTTSALAGRGSGLTLTLLRRSGEQLLDRFDVSLPRGLSASFDSVQACAEEAAASATCPPESRVGSATGAVGSGGDPAVLDGNVYLTGPYRHAPFGLALVFRAAIGRFDLGTIVVRAALRVDPGSGRLSVQSDVLPSMIEGIPIRFQAVGLDIDRPDFVRTPTSCDPASLAANLRSTGGARVTVSSPFQVRGCNSLRFSPRLSVGLTGVGQLSRGDHPAVGIAIRSRDGEANLRSVDIGLPRSLHQDLGGLRSICARQDALEGSCPTGSRVGRATAVSPLFHRAASGPVSLVQPAGDGPPELWATLAAEGVQLFAHGQVLSRGGRVHAKLTGLPDLPLTKLSLRLNGGSGGLLSLAANPCTRDRPQPKVSSALEGQNHAYLISNSRLRQPRCADSAASRRSLGRAVRRG